MTVLQELMERAHGLTADEQLRLAAYLVERARRAPRLVEYRWQDLAGLAPDLLDEDAQEWVSRNRREGSARREALWNP